MTFNVHAKSADMRSSVHAFDGDEQIDPVAYEQAIFAGYVSTVSTLYGVARSNGLQVDTETFERWKRITSATGLVDEFLDDSADAASAREYYLAHLDAHAEDLSARLEGQTDLLGDSLRLLKHSILPMPHERRYRLVRTARNIGFIAIEKANCDDAYGYVEVLLEEGRLAAMLATESVSSHVRSQPGYVGFARWCVPAIEAATLLDHARDLGRDYEAGITQVDPSVRHSLFIARAAMSPLGEIFSSPSMMRATARGLGSRLRFSMLPTKVTMKFMGSSRRSS